MDWPCKTILLAGQHIFWRTNLILGVNVYMFRIGTERAFHSLVDTEDPVVECIFRSPAGAQPVSWVLPRKDVALPQKGVVAQGAEHRPNVTAVAVAENNDHFGPRVRHPHCRDIDFLRWDPHQVPRKIIDGDVRRVWSWKQKLMHNVHDLIPLQISSLNS